MSLWTVSYNDLIVYSPCDPLMKMEHGCNDFDGGKPKYSETFHILTLSTTNSSECGGTEP
jgi:hypothetical protein